MNQDATLTLTSSAFAHTGTIPSTYTCDGQNSNPPLEIIGVPAGAQSLALIMDDPDIPDEVKQSRGIEVFDHWVVFNLPPTTHNIQKGTKPEGVEGKNSTGELGYTGPCPPPQYQPTKHRYFFKLYALDTQLNLAEGATKADVEKAMEGHILQETQLVGTYERERV